MFCAHDKAIYSNKQFKNPQHTSLIYSIKMYLRFHLQTILKLYIKEIFFYNEF